MSTLHERQFARFATLRLRKLAIFTRKNLPGAPATEAPLSKRQQPRYTRARSLTHA